MASSAYGARLASDIYGLHRYKPITTSQHGKVVNEKKPPEWSSKYCFDGYVDL